MKFWRARETYRSGDRVFAILRHPQVALLLTCDAPKSWNVTIFDFQTKEAVLKTHRRGSLAQAKRYGIVQAKVLYTAIDPDVLWHEAVVRGDMLQV